MITPELIVVGHGHGDATGSEEHLVTWYATPSGLTPNQYEEAPDDAVAAEERDVLEAGVESLMRLFPRLANDRDAVQAAAFAGFKQNFNGVPTQRACEVVDPDRNLMMDLPSVLTNAVPNSVEAVSLLRQRLGQPADRAADIPHHGAVVGNLNELSDQTIWRNWGDFTRHHGVPMP